MKTILFFSTLTLWSLGKGKGGPAFTKTIEAYQADGWDVYLISDEPQNKDCSLLDEAHNICLPPSVFKPLTHRRFISQPFKLLDQLSMVHRFGKAAQRILGSRPGPCIAYAYEVHGVTPCAGVARKYHLPMVTRFQGTVLCDKKLNLVNRYRWIPHFSALAHPADLVIMTNDGTQGDRVLKELGNNSKTLFYLNGLELLEMDLPAMKAGFDRAAFLRGISEKISPEECVFLTVSRLASWKRVDRCIVGFAEYCRKNPAGKLVIVGEGDQRQALETLAEGLGIRERVFFVGSVEHRRVYDYMLACDVFLSLYDLSNVGNPLLEAMTLGKCIVTLDVGDTRNFIQDKQNGVLLTADRLDDLGETMSLLANAPLLRVQYGSAAESFSREHFWTWKDRMHSEVENVEQLLAVPGRRPLDK